MKQHLARLLFNTELMPGYHLMRLESPNISSEGKPGQFVSISCGQDTILRRPLSIHRVDSPKEFSILFAVVGSGTEWLAQRKKGDMLDVLGPLGNGFLIPDSSKRLLLAAGGIGIAPLIFLAQKAVNNGKTVRLLLGASTKDCLYPLRLLPQKVETFITTEDGSSGVKGKLTDILPEHVDWAERVYACGPLAMYKAMAEHKEVLRIREKIQLSLEVRLGCGIGACLGCSIKTAKGMKKVCSDGPVFNLDEVLLEEVRI
ncbi:MAG TPA: dihydroorotate dehydrogenase electron transfer subunit [Dehalococcoidia bacterium]